MSKRPNIFKKKLNNIRVLITGGGRRIGAAICEALATRSCRVIIHCNTSWRSARLLAKRLKVKTGKEVPVICKNLQSREDCEWLTAEAWKSFGGLDVLINNAAVFGYQSSLKTKLADFETHVMTNYFVPVWLTESFARHIKERSQFKTGKDTSFIPQIINMLDCRTEYPLLIYLPYIVSKAMLAEYTKSSASYLAPHVIINGIAPGPVLPPVKSESLSIPAGKILTRRKPEVNDIIRAVIYLLESEVITGQIIYVDSGQHLIYT